MTVAGFGGGGLGNFFRVITNREAEAVLGATWDAGIRYFDTAPFYGRGRSERRLGAFLSDRSRDDFIVSTKVGRLLVPAKGHVEHDGIFSDPAPFNSRYDYGYGGVMRSYESSLQRLGLDRVNILLVHDIGVAQHHDEAAAQLKTLQEGGLKALEELRGAGDIKGYGLGVNEVEACLQCLDYGDPDGFLLAGRLTLLEQHAASPLLARCTERQVSLIVGGVFNSGVLATGAVAGARYNYADAPVEILQRVCRLESVCARHAIPLAAAAVQFPFVHPAVATVLLGVATLASLDRSVKAFETLIPHAFWDELASEGFLESS